MLRWLLIGSWKSMRGVSGDARNGHSVLYLVIVDAVYSLGMTSQDASLSGSSMCLSLEILNAFCCILRSRTPMPPCWIGRVSSWCAMVCGSL